MSQPSADIIPVELAYARPERQFLLNLDVPAGSTVQDVVERSGILKSCPEIDLKQCKLGVWGRVCAADKTLEAKDRVEIYRPLLADPKEARRKRAKS